MRVCMLSLSRYFTILSLSLSLFWQEIQIYKCDSGIPFYGHMYSVEIHQRQTKTNSRLYVYCSPLDSKPKSCCSTDFELSIGRNCVSTWSILTVEITNLCYATSNLSRVKNCNSTCPRDNLLRFSLIALINFAKKLFIPHFPHIIQFHLLFEKHPLLN